MKNNKRFEPRVVSSFDEIFRIGLIYVKASDPFSTELIHAVHFHNDAVATGNHIELCAPNCPIRMDDVIEISYIFPANLMQYTIRTKGQTDDR
jgi:hypothetical protein